jgi:hypothetical protein
MIEMKKLTFFLTTMIIAIMVIVGCDDDKITAPNTGMLDLNINGLENLGSGFAFEGWIIVNGSPLSTGIFTVDDNGDLSQSSFELNLSDLQEATKFVLTIEPSPDNDPTPAPTKYLAGDFSNRSAAVTVEDPAALGDDFMSSSGPYILNTPSTASTDLDYSAGIWWLDPGAGPGATLDLPVLPDGWVYEGWVVGNSGPITTGRFTMAAGADSDQGGPTAGPDPVPPFPGQDYINPLIDLIGYTAVISIEPEPDNSTDPFTLKPLVDANIEDVTIGVLQSMNNNAASFPTGTVSW